MECRRHGEKVLILIDEYDTPIHNAYSQGYAPQILDFMRSFLGPALKTNPHLYRAVVTGILRIAKESLFSDLNNLGVYSLLATPFNTCFGFTEPEVTALLAQAGQREKIAQATEGAWTSSPPPCSGETPRGSRSSFRLSRRICCPITMCRPGGGGSRAGLSGVRARVAGLARARLPGSLEPGVWAWAA